MAFLKRKVNLFRQNLKFLADFPDLEASRPTRHGSGKHSSKGSLLYGGLRSGMTNRKFGSARSRAASRYAHSETNPTSSPGSFSAKRQLACLLARIASKVTRIRSGPIDRKLNENETWRNLLCAFHLSLLIHLLFDLPLRGASLARALGFTSRTPNASASQCLDYLMALLHRLLCSLMKRAGVEHGSIQPFAPREDLHPIHRSTGRAGAAPCCAGPRSPIRLIWAWTCKKNGAAILPWTMLDPLELKQKL